MGSFHRRTMRVVRQSSDAGYRLTELPDVTAACTRCGGCMSALNNPDGSVAVGINLPKSLSIRQDARLLKSGQLIEIAVPSKILLALSSVVYLLPVVLMLFFAVSCDLLFAASEVQVAGSAVVGLCLGLGSIVFFEPTLRSHISSRLTLRSGTDSHQ